jgi:hypothetical protein
LFFTIEAGGSQIRDAATENEDDLTTSNDTTNISHYCERRKRRNGGEFHGLI